MRDADYSLQFFTSICVIESTFYHSESQTSKSNFSVFNIYCPFSSSCYSQPVNPFLGLFTCSLPVPTTTPHEFLISGDFDKHVGDPLDLYANKFLTHLNSNSLNQHVNLRIHEYDHVFTSADLDQSP